MLIINCNNTNHSRLVLIIGAVLLCACSFQPQQHDTSTQQLQFHFDEQDWILHNRGKTSRGTFKRYLLRSENNDNWQQRVNVIQSTESRTHQQWLTLIQTAMSNACSSFDYQLLDEPQRGFSYQWHQQACQQYREQHETGKFIETPQGIYIITYTAKKKAYKAPRFKRWIQRIQEAQLGTKTIN